VQVVRVGAHCELRSSEGPSASFTVVEFAVLSDGRRVTADCGLGFGGRRHRVGQRTDGPSEEPDYWAGKTQERLGQSVLVTVEARYEDATPEQRWSGLVALLRAADVQASADELGGLDYAVEFGPEVVARLRAPGS
jgi:hypothetical protein